jgi:hypothetical protein
VRSQIPQTSREPGVGWSRSTRCVLRSIEHLDKYDCAFCAAQLDYCTRLSSTVTVHRTFLRASALSPSSLPILLLGRRLVLEALTPHRAAQAIMSLVFDSVGPPPHLLQSRPLSWSNPYVFQEYPASTSSPAPMSPKSLQNYTSYVPESPLPSQEVNNLPASSWYSPSVSAPEYHAPVRTTLSR